MPAAFDDVADYLAAVPDTHRAALETLYAQIKRFYPEVSEHIKWSQPLFKLDGQTLCAFKAHKNHSALGVWSDSALGRLADTLDGYDYAQSTVRFAFDQPLPDKIVKAILDERAKEIRRSSTTQR
jgi:uncharacterized protein YdhG (YjbR/CyaY superfamily)